MEVITFNVGQSASPEQIVHVLREDSTNEPEVSTEDPKAAVIFIQQAQKKLLDANGPLSFGGNYLVVCNQAI